MYIFRSRLKYMSISNILFCQIFSLKEYIGDFCRALWRFIRAASTDLSLFVSYDPSRGYSLKGTEKILPPGSPYSFHGSPLRTPMSSGHGSPQDSPHVIRHRRDSEHSSGAVSRRSSSDVVSPLPESHPLGSPDGRGRRRSDYSPHQGRSIHMMWQQKNIRLRSQSSIILFRPWYIGKSKQIIKKDWASFIRIWYISIRLPTL